MNNVNPIFAALLSDVREATQTLANCAARGQLQKDGTRMPNEDHEAAHRLLVEAEAGGQRMNHHETIIEAAARALRDANIYDAPVWKTYHQMASAMLVAVTPLIRAAALEEAAQVAEDYDGRGINEDDAALTCDEIAAAIRALIQATPPPTDDSA